MLGNYEKPRNKNHKIWFSGLFFFVAAALAELAKMFKNVRINPILYKLNLHKLIQLTLTLSQNLKGKHCMKIELKFLINLRKIFPSAATVALKSDRSLTDGLDFWWV